MGKESFYFKHDYGARNDKKMVNLLKKEGLEGVGIYWCIVEMLYEEGGTLMLEDCDGIAFALKSHASRIKKVVMDFKLFDNDGIRFWSESVNRRLKEREQIADRNRKNAQNGWDKRKGDATGVRDGTLIRGEERKGEEKRGEERIEEIGERGSFFVTVKTKYANEKQKRVWNLEMFFELKQQLQQIKNSHWGAVAKFSEFMETNAGREFDDDDHLYGSYRKFCTEGSKEINGKPQAFDLSKK